MAEDLITVHFAGVERRIALWAGITVDTLVRSIQSSFGVNAPIAVILREPDNVVVPAEYVVAMRKGSFNIVFAADAGASMSIQVAPQQQVQSVYGIPPVNPQPGQPGQPAPQQQAYGQPQPAQQQGQAGQPAPAAGQPGAAAPAGEDDDDDEEKGVDRSGWKADFEGFLDKKGDKGFIGSRFWVKRFFRFYQSEQLLCYFKNDKTFIQTGQISMGGVLLIEKTTEKGNSFNITMKTSARVWRLSAKDDATRMQWVNLLQPHVKGYEPPPKIATRPARKRKGMPPVYQVKSVQFMAEVEQSASTRHDANPGADVPVHKAADGEVYLQLFGNHHAYVMEYRHLDLDEEKKVWVHNLPKTLKDNETGIAFRSLTDPAASILQQQFFYDEKTPEELLKKLIGKEIEVSQRRDKHFNTDAKFSGVVIYEPHQGKYALYNKKDNTVHFLDTHEPISYNLLGNKNEELIPHGKTNLYHEPSAHWLIESEQKQHLAELSYTLTDAFEWNVTYNGVLNHKESEMDLTAWYDIKNKSGKTYEGARIMVLADPSEKPKLTKEEEAAEKEAAEKAAAAAEAKAKSALGGFGFSLPSLGGDAPAAEPPKPRIYKYYIQQTPTLVDDSNKQIRLVTAKVPVTSQDMIRFDTPDFTTKPKIGQADGTDAGAKCETVIEFYNNEQSHLNLLMPAGRFNISRREKDTFGVNKVSHTKISHYYPNDIVTVSVEDLEHVTATRKQLGFNLDRDKLFMVEQVEITIVNGRLEPVDLVVQESAFRWQTYELTDSQPAFQPHPTHPRLFQWKLHINAMEDATINYTIFYKQFTID